MQANENDPVFCIGGDGGRLNSRTSAHHTTNRLAIRTRPRTSARSGGRLGVGSEDLGRARDPARAALAVRAVARDRIGGESQLNRATGTKTPGTEHPFGRTLDPPAFADGPGSLRIAHIAPIFRPTRYMRAGQRGCHTAPPGAVLRRLSPFVDPRPSSACRSRRR